MLKFIKEQMSLLDIPYEFMEWTSAVQYPYVVGEYTETPTLDEDGKEESTMILTATTRGAWLELEEIKNKIKNHFPSVGGLRAETDSGVIVVYYSDAFPVPTGEAELKRIQINLDVREWKGLN